MLAVGITIGWIAETAKRQQRAVQNVRELGGTIGYEYEGPFVDLTPGRLSFIFAPKNSAIHGLVGPALPEPAPGWLIGCLGIDFFDEVVSVDLSKREVDLLQVRKFRSLRRLNLNRARWLTNIEPLKTLTDLEWLELFGTQVSDLTPIGELKKLKVLNIQDTNVETIETIEALAQLRSLDLSDTAVKDFATLKSFRELLMLSVANTRFSDVELLQGLTELRLLDLRGAPVSDLSPLVDLEHVVIILGNTQSPTIPTKLEARVRRS
jgi:hypothetical protein